MRHCSRCTNQNKAINIIENKMKTSCMDRKIKGVTAIMIHDFKMKFEPISSRETTGITTERDKSHGMVFA